MGEAKDNNEDEIQISQLRAVVNAVDGNGNKMDVSFNASLSGNDGEELNDREEPVQQLLSDSRVFEIQDPDEEGCAAESQVQASKAEKQYIYHSRLSMMSQ